VSRFADGMSAATEHLLRREPLAPSNFRDPAGFAVMHNVAPRGRDVVDFGDPSLSFWGQNATARVHHGSRRGSVAISGGRATADSACDRLAQGLSSGGSERGSRHTQRGEMVFAGTGLR
jgi:hypothetical protein